MVDLFFIKTFVCAAQTGSFRVAAERNFITQPAVSQHIQVLEKIFGTKLFERRGKKISLTPNGQTFLPFAESLLKTYDEAKMILGETLNKYNGTIRIATIYSIGLHELQPIIRRFLNKYPQIDIQIDYCHNNAIYEMILHRTIDFGLVAYPKKMAGVVCEIFAEDDLILIQSRRHPMIKKSISLKELNQQKMITFSPQTPTGNAIERFLKTNGIRVKIVHAYDNIETIKRAVEIGMGVAFVPRNTVTQELKNHSLSLISAKGLNLKRPLGLLYAKGKTFTKSTKTFHDMLTQKRN